MRLRNIILFVAFCSFTAYYVYEPLPEEIEEKWKLMLTNCFFKTLSHMVRNFFFKNNFASLILKCIAGIYVADSFGSNV